MDAKTPTLTPATELARRSPVRIPNESAEYRAARTALLAEEIELRRHIERVNEQRRALPPGGEVAGDYRSFVQSFINVADQRVRERGQAEIGRAQQRWSDHFVQPWRRQQAEVSRYRFQAKQRRRPGQGRGDRIRSEPHLPHRAAPLHGRREAVHPRAEGPRRRHPG